jgi:hypothetical protein
MSEFTLQALNVAIGSIAFEREALTLARLHMTGRTLCVEKRTGESSRKGNSRTAVSRMPLQLRRILSRDLTRASRSSRHVRSSSYCFAPSIGRSHGSRRLIQSS